MGPAQHVEKVVQYVNTLAQKLVLPVLKTISLLKPQTIAYREQIALMELGKMEQLAKLVTLLAMAVLEMEIRIVLNVKMDMWGMEYWDVFLVIQIVDSEELAVGSAHQNAQLAVLSMGIYCLRMGQLVLLVVL